MHIDKLVNSKLNTIADWIIRVVVINILTIVCALPLITAYAALGAGYNRFQDYLQGREGALISGYFHHFRHALLKKIGLGIVLTVLFSLVVFNTRYYLRLTEDAGGAWTAMGYVISLVLLALLLVVTLYSFAVLRVTSSLQVTALFKVAFYLSGKFFFRTMLLIPTVILPVFLLITPLTALGFVFAGVSVPLLINAYLTLDAVDHLERLASRHETRH